MVLADDPRVSANHPRGTLNDVKVEGKPVSGSHRCLPFVTIGGVGPSVIVRLSRQHGLSRRGGLVSEVR